MGNGKWGTVGRGGLHHLVCGSNSSLVGFRLVRVAGGARVLGTPLRSTYLARGTSMFFILPSQLPDRRIRPQPKKCEGTQHTS